jgi:hypothetical protein
MAEDSQDGIARSPEATDADAAAVAMGLGNASRVRADEYLAKQSRLTELRIDYLAEQDRFELSHLRFRRFSDYARFALETAAFVFALFVLIGLGTMVWRAATDQSLVVDAFNVPQDLAQRGVTGEVLARRILNQLHLIQLQSQSARNTKSYRSGVEGRIDFDIPQTGISLAQLQALLNDWLGHTTHISGALSENAHGSTLAVQFGDAPEVIVARPDSDIEPLIQETAERIYRRAEPYRYANFLRRTGRTAEALPQLEELALSGDAEDRKWALPDWGVLVAQTAREGDRRNTQKFGVEKFREAIAIDPNFVNGWTDLLVVERALGHDEESLAAARRADALGLQASPEEYEPKRREADLHSIRSDVGALTGDYRGAVAEQSLAAKRDRDLFGPEVIISDDLHLTEALIGDHDLAWAGRIIADLDSSAAFYATLPTSSQTRIKYVFGILHQDMAFAREQWSAASANGAALENAPAPANLAVPLDQARWKSALALAYAGDFADAERLVAATPGDCDACLSARGNIAAAEKQWPRSAYWFARAAVQAPSLPFADSDWGRMLLAKGDLDGAIAKFRIANEKGPHFADPLEMWGEALMRENRSDLALAKFAEADKYAPKWGRLYLKWGEALLWSGNKADAQKRFAIAASLDLSAADRSQLARMRGSNG